MRVLLFLLFIIFVNNVFGQEYKLIQPLTPKDPLKSKVYQLSNGLKVYLSENHSEPRIYTAIAVNAGGKNDPANSTGLAHYLEHMVFKGTDKFGTINYEKERKEIDIIYQLYDTYNKEKDPIKRKIIYHQIDSVSGVAAKYAIPNEYDKMIAELGGRGSNAFTTEESTVYIGDIPTNQFEKWLKIESERFRNPVMRLFHTELEAVYEEKNISLDSDSDQAWELLLSNIFKSHPYGTQTVIGTTEHLKNPSLIEIEKYYRSNYVPTNMAMILSGDFDSDKVINMIAKYFGNLPSKPKPSFTFTPEKPIDSPIVVELKGPESEFSYIAYRYPGSNDNDALIFEVIRQILYNDIAGLLDINLNKQQKVLSAAAYTASFNDYSFFFFEVKPATGQSLQEATKLVQNEIQNLKKGNFNDGLLQGAIINKQIAFQKALVKNDGRVFIMADLFKKGQDIQKYIADIEFIKSLKKEDIMRVANKYFQEGYVLVNKTKGERPEKKIEKPEITPVETNRDSSSTFLKDVSKLKITDIAPNFVDFNNEIKRIKLNADREVRYVLNKDNELFNLRIVLDIGKVHSPMQALTLDYFERANSAKYTSDQIRLALYSIGCSASTYYTENESFIVISGLNSKFEKAITLLMEHLQNPIADEQAVSAIIAKEMQTREDNKFEPRIIFEGLSQYAKYGPNNLFKAIMPEKQLKKLTGNDFVAWQKKWMNSPFYLEYFGPMTETEVSKILGQIFANCLVKEKLPKNLPTCIDRDETRVFFVHYDMVQTEILWQKPLQNYTIEAAPLARLWNEYLSGSMAGIVFQQIRESQGLAYSTNANYGTPIYKQQPYYFTAYIGTQVDKMPDAIKSMNKILTNFPQSEVVFNVAKKSVINDLSTARITNEEILYEYAKHAKLELQTNLYKYIYEKTPSLSIKDIANFHNQYIGNKPYTYVVIGDKNKIDMKYLQSLGKVEEVSLYDIFGY